MTPRSTPRRTPRSTPRPDGVTTAGNRTAQSHPQPDRKGRSAHICRKEPGSWPGPRLRPARFVRLRWRSGAKERPGAGALVA